jgi:hypothetical protein
MNIGGGIGWQGVTACVDGYMCHSSGTSPNLPQGPFQANSLTAIVHLLSSFLVSVTNH